MIELLRSLDQRLFLFLNSLNAESLNPIMTFLSGQVIWIPLVLLFILLAFIKLKRKEAWIFVLFLGLSVAASDVTSSYISKNLFNRLRPCHEEEIKTAIHDFGQRCGGRFGFVSSHAANATTLVTFAVSTLRFGPWRYLLWLLPLTVGYSRIYLGVHYPGDILGGVLIGFSWASLLAMGFRSRSRGQSEHIPTI